MFASCRLNGSGAMCCRIEILCAIYVPMILGRGKLGAAFIQHIDTIET